MALASAMPFIAVCGAAVQPRVVAFLGDSITAGYGVNPGRAYPALIEQEIKRRGWNVKIVNAGQSGDTTSGGLSRLDWLLRTPIDVLLVELGGNDGLRGVPIDTIERNLMAIVRRSKQRYPQIHVIVAGMKLPPELGREYTTRFAQVFPRVAEETGAALIPFILDGVGGVREFNLADGIHPTEKGHQMIAANVWKALEPVLQSLVRADSAQPRAPRTQ
ncbi:MAG TPA: arylesterase [Candidatus Binatia bacterium]|nr:arylesterase [Candidatus Binatia bacterium]